MDEPTEIDNSSTNNAKIVDEPAEIDNSSTNNAKIVDEPAEIDNSSTKSAKIMDEPGKNDNSSTKSTEIVDELVKNGRWAARPYLQSMMSRIMRSVAFMPAEPMAPRLRMVFSTSSSIMPSVEGMQAPRRARTAD